MLPKFRAWDTTLKIMHDVQIIDWISETVGVDAIGGVLETPLKELKLMQSTGLKGQNGIEVFDGDIVRLFNVGFIYKGVVAQNSATYWWIKGVGTSTDFTFEDVADYRNYTCELEVIGNIYENQDLLEVAK
ncbi:YopX family protein [Lactococcus raffinolactis]|uniref:YopX family protein n=1 Tax=Pseudolactococcus raffinolactis TaxID=1366 RepID=UPI0014367BEC|nr:YopX family protein [Lactococcus raffinolactis]QIW51202.1 hypothetical protein GU337_04585 [Lactococcus raffinolactis]